MTTDVNIINDRGQFKFLANIAGEEAYIEYLEYKDDIVFLQTCVPEKIQQSGIAAQLAQAVLDFARVEKKKIFPFCSFVARYIKLHPEYRDLLDEHYYEDRS